MAPRSQPQRLEHPLDASQVEAVDQMFQELYDDIQNDSIFPSTTEGDILYRGDERLERLAIGAENTVLRTDGVVPEWGKVDLATSGDTTGILPVPSGGTGVASVTAYAVVVGGTTSTGALQDVGSTGTLGQVLTSDGSGAKPAWADPDPAANLILNGGFDLAQRQAFGTPTTYSQTAARAYTADRWGITNENASVQYARVDASATPETGLLAPFYGQYTKITNAGKICISQPIEGNLCVHLKSQTARVQVKMKASTATTMRIALLQLTAAGTIDTIPGYASGAPSGTFISAFGVDGTDPTFGTNLSKITPVTADNATIASDALTCSVTTAWQRFGGTFTLPSDFKNLILVIYSNADIGIAATVSLTEAGLYHGKAFRPWATLDQASLAFKAFRYYSKSFGLATAPAQNVGLSSAVWGTVSVAGIAADQPIIVRYLTILRSGTPTFTFYNPSAANAFARNTTRGTDATATASANANGAGFDANFTGIAAWTVGDIVRVHYTADAEF